MKQKMSRLEQIEHRPIHIPKATYDLILKEEKPFELMGLYCFYYYTAIWQRTNQPRATTNYTATAGNVSEIRVRKLKKVLMRLGLIEDKVAKDSKNRITKHYIQVCYYAGKATPKETHGVESFGTNACSNGKRNAYRNNRGGGKTKAATLDLDEITSFDEEYAKRLEVIIGSSMSRKVMLKRWVNEVRNIRVKDGVPKKEMKAVLKWYKKHYNDKFTPKIYRVADFREKFRRIEDAMKRDVEDAPKEVVISEKVKELAKELSDEFAWPKGSGTQLAETVQISLDRYRNFYDKVRGFVLDGQCEEIVRFHKCLWDALWSPEPFVKNWMYRVYESIENWDDWNGNLIAMAFDVKSKRFQQQGRIIATEYCANPERFDRYMKVLYSK